ncbi:hypothetical protein ACFL54_01355 [Planctomycetota bacterium]
MTEKELGQFHFPKSAFAATARKGLLHLLSSSLSNEVFSYITCLDIFIRPLGASKMISYRAFNVYLPKVKKYDYPDLLQCQPVDVMIVGYSNRPAEIITLGKVIMDLAANNRSILYLCSFDSDEHHYLQSLTAGISDLITFFDIKHLPNSDIESDRQNSLEKAKYTLQCIQKQLQLKEMDIAVEAALDAQLVAIYQDAWKYWRDVISPDSIFVRNIHSPECCAIAHDAIRMGIPVTSIQHSVIAAVSPYIPLMANNYLCFGNCSIDLLNRMENDVHEKTGFLKVENKKIAAGSMVDELPDTSNCFHNKTLLVIDQYSNWAEDYFGLHECFKELPKTVEQLAQSQSGLDKIVIRTHPENQRAESWQNILHKYGDLIEISSSIKPLREDIVCSSVAIGIFSTALVAAAASGLPTCFFWRPGWYYTPDLRIYRESGYFMESLEFVEWLYKIISDKKSYGAERRKILEISQEYFTPTSALKYCSMI